MLGKGYGRYPPAKEIQVRSRHISPNLAHVEDGQLHAVAACLHVLLVPSEDGGYYAQGIEIDYGASGATVEEAKQHFERGFVETLAAYVRRGIDLAKLYTASTTPDEYKEAYALARQQPVFECVVGVKLPEQARDRVPNCLGFVLSPAAVAAL